jgi:hypothetical protein
MLQLFGLDHLKLSHVQGLDARLTGVGGHVIKGLDRLRTGVRLLFPFSGSGEKEKG